MRTERKKKGKNLTSIRPPVRSKSYSTTAIFNRKYDVLLRYQAVMYVEHTAGRKTWEFRASLCPLSINKTQICVEGQTRGRCSANQLSTTVCREVSTGKKLQTLATNHTKCFCAHRGLQTSANSTLFENIAKFLLQRTKLKTSSWRKMSAPLTTHAQ